MAFATLVFAALALFAALVLAALSFFAFQLVRLVTDMAAEQFSSNFGTGTKRPVTFRCNGRMSISRNADRKTTCHQGACGQFLQKLTFCLL
ncbi:MAG: hypothetical protein KDD44_09610 [Bdellovibrionales bacterium]|nr:hypothetical protein [Bdellovibrionales bacterium]